MIADFLLVALFGLLFTIGCEILKSGRNRKKYKNKIKILIESYQSD
jgi:hypothetical protein